MGDLLEQVICYRADSVLSDLMMAITQFQAGCIRTSRCCFFMLINVILQQVQQLARMIGLERFDNSPCLSFLRAEFLAESSSDFWQYPV